MQPQPNSFEYYGGPCDGEVVQLYFELGGHPVLPETISIPGHSEGTYRLEIDSTSPEPYKYIWKSFL